MFIGLRGGGRNLGRSSYAILRMMATIKEAAENAIAFAQAVLGPERVVGARIEEVESTTVAGDDAWLITLSMIRPDVLVGNLAAALGVGKREYKTFTVRKINGEVTSMKIRELADA